MFRSLHGIACHGRYFTKRRVKHPAPAPRSKAQWVKRNASILSLSKEAGDEGAFYTYILSLPKDASFDYGKVRLRSGCCIQPIHELLSATILCKGISLPGWRLPRPNERASQ